MYVSVHLICLLYTYSFDAGDQEKKHASYMEGQLQKEMVYFVG